jgi:hypothetical protein
MEMIRKMLINVVMLFYIIYDTIVEKFNNIGR